MNCHLSSLASCFVNVSILLAVELSAATNTPAVIKGGLVFGVTDDLPSSSDPLELLNDSYLVSTNVCQFLIYNSGSNTEPLWVPRANLSPFKIELKDSNGKGIQMTRLGSEVSKAPKISNSRWSAILPWQSERESSLMRWHTGAGNCRFAEFPNLDKFFQIQKPGDYFATVRVRYWTKTNTTWFENLSAPATFIWHVPVTGATNAPP
jgi:hypothetical protein